MTHTTHHRAGDGVYLAAKPVLTGTVMAASGAHCRVKWNDPERPRHGWYGADELEGPTVHHPTAYHSVTDRVYLVADGRLTGTVTDTTAGADGRFCRVHWDGTPAASGSWHADHAVESYWLPEGAR